MYFSMACVYGLIGVSVCLCARCIIMSHGLDSQFTKIKSCEVLPGTVYR